MIWIFLGFFLALFTLWQTDLEGARLNRAGFMGLGITFLFVLAAMIIISCINGESVLAPVISIIFVLVVCFGGGILIFYRSMKKQGRLDRYETYQDIMTEEEFERWQARKRSDTHKKG